MVKTGKVSKGSTPCIICGAPSCVVLRGNAFCLAHRDSPNTKNKVEAKYDK